MVGGGRRDKESFSPLPVSQGGAGVGWGIRMRIYFFFSPLIPLYSWKVPRRGWMCVRERDILHIKGSWEKGLWGGPEIHRYPGSEEADAAKFRKYVIVRTGAL